MRLYIYNQDDNEIMYCIDRDSNAECEAVAATVCDDDVYAWSYTDYGLIETTDTDYL